MSIKDYKSGFTLAETMIVLVILGIVAAITVPALVRNQIDAQNRTRLRKAMTVYDMALNKMVVENDFKNTTALTDWGNGNNCVNTKPYFKVAEENANNCIFRSSDGVWWNIEDITHPIIAFNFDDLDKADEENNKAFHFVGYLDDNGSLRVSDLAKATGDDQKYLTKLYNFINNIKSGLAENGPSLTTIRPRTICDGTGEFCSSYDEYGRLIVSGEWCSGDTISSCEYKYVYDYTDGLVTPGANCYGTTIDTCSLITTNTTYDPQTAGWETGSGCNNEGKCQWYHSYEDGIQTTYVNCPNNDRSQKSHPLRFCHQGHDTVS